MSTEHTLLEYAVPWAGGTLRARMGFLTDPDGGERACLTGRLDDARGRMLATGAIHDIIVTALLRHLPIVTDFAAAHGHYADGPEADSWERARTAFAEMTAASGANPSEIPGCR